jgi:hypothetical protein
MSTHLSDHDFSESVRAVRTALAEMEAGDRGAPFSEFDAAFRARHGIQGKMQKLNIECSRLDGVNTDGIDAD